MSDQTGRAAEAVKLRNVFTKDAYVSFLKANIALSIAILALIVFAIMGWTRKIEPVYFLATADGKLIRMEASDKPSVNRSTLLDWTTKAVMKANTYNFTQWREQLTVASADFTNKGWESFQQALKASGNLEAVIARRLIATARVDGPVVVSREYIDPARRYTWIVQIPFIITYEGSGSSRNEQRLLATVTVVRVPTTESEKGIGIDAIVTDSRR
jgi:intracellular multiplication protein IcmL